MSGQLLHQTEEIFELRRHNDCDGGHAAGSTRAWQHHWKGFLEGAQPMCNTLHFHETDKFVQPRYVVFGHSPPLETQIDLSSSSARKSLRSSSAKASQVDVSQVVPDRFYITVYKTKGDVEYVSQHPIYAFKACEVRNVAHRKQSPSVPTLILDFKPDAFAEKKRKRRSSRAGTLTSAKDPWADVLLFRTLSEERFSIFDWQLLLKPRLNYLDSEDSTLSPPPDFTAFSNQFRAKDGKAQSSGGGPDIQTRSQTSKSPRTHREKPSALISPSPSLKSRRSDLSSQASSQPPPPRLPTTHLHNFVPPADIPSPASTSFDTHFVEVSTANQGRSSALSSHTRGSNSIASAVSPHAFMASTPPGPRETILDRAFQMRCIPGSELLQDNDDEKMSSMARFEALMREQDERRQKKAALNQQTKELSTWEAKEESEASEEDTDRDPEDLDLSDHDVEIPTPAQRALAYISGRATPPHALSPGPTTPPIPFLHQQGMSALQNHTPSPFNNLRPRTGSSQKRKSRPSSICVTSRSMSDRSMSENTIPGLLESNSNLSLAEKRRSSASMRRINLNFQEFTKRLSSTSSLLLPTNASSSSLRDGSSRGSADFGGPLGGLSVDGEDDVLSFSTGSIRAKRNSVNVRGPSIGGEAEKRCAWKGNMNMFGEGTFI